MAHRRFTPRLEQRLTEFLQTEDTILYTSCFDANGGLFETLLGPEDAIISDQLNHASIIDGVRLCKASRFRYANSDMSDLETQLKAASSARFRMIATDGVFSMDGYIAKLPDICELADKYDAMIMVDDSHSVGFMGRQGRGTHEYHDCLGRIDVITGTLGKALGGVRRIYQWSDIPVVVRKLLNSYVNVRGLICFRILFADAMPGVYRLSYLARSYTNSQSDLVSELFKHL